MIWVYIGAVCVIASVVSVVLATVLAELTENHYKYASRDRLGPRSLMGPWVTYMPIVGPVVFGLRLVYYRFSR